MHAAAVLIFILAALLFSYLYIIRPWHLHWGATHLDRIAVLPGDALSPYASAVVTHAVNIDAPAEAVWRWLVQIGQDRGGFYSYSFLENLAGCDMHNTFRIVPEWQQRAIGDTHFDSHGVLAFKDRFSYNLGGGIKYLFAPQVALRAEVRWSPSRTTASSTTFCDPTLGCFTTPANHHAQQGQADIGLEFRLGSWRR